MSLSILGTGSALPEKVLTNDDLAQFLDTSDEWITTRTGVKRRHILAQGEKMSSLVAKAANLAIENAGITAADIGYIICATLGGDYLTPSLACTVQKEIGASCPAVDMNAACSGFIYALDMAAGLLLRKRAQKILVVAAEGLSRVADWTDRSTAVLFGDGAGAAVVGPGEGLEYIHVTASGWAEPLNAPFPPTNFPGYAPGPAPVLYMDGGEIYKFAVNAICTAVREAMEATGLEMEQVGHVILHQANLRIIEAARRRFAIPREKCPISIDETGNISAGCMPLLLDRLSRAGELKQGEAVILSAFGAGLTTGTAVLRWRL